MVQNKQQIISLLESQKIEIRKLGAERLGLFGSFVRGEQKDSSDIDLVVEFEVVWQVIKNDIPLANEWINHIIVEEKLSH